MNVIDAAIVWVKDKNCEGLSNEALDDMFKKIKIYPHRQKADLNKLRDALTICFGKERQEILLYRQNVSIGDVIVHANKIYEVKQIYYGRYNDNLVEVLDWNII